MQEYPRHNLVKGRLSSFLSVKWSEFILEKQNVLFIWYKQCYIKYIFHQFRSLKKKNVYRVPTQSLCGILFMWARSSDFSETQYVASFSEEPYTGFPSRSTSMAGVFSPWRMHWCWCFLSTTGAVRIQQSGGAQNSASITTTLNQTYNDHELK